MTQKLIYILAVILASAQFVHAQEYDMQKSMELASPNENHQRLETDFGGSWKYNMTSTMDGMTMTGSGTSNSTMILGGRFIMMNAEGSMMGMNVKSMTIMGYDNAKAKYTMIGLDELGTYYITAEGDYDTVTKVYTLDGTYEEPVLKKIQDYRFIMDVSDTLFPIVKVLFENEQGGWDEIMSMTYSR
jgi:hypothetical protein